MFNNNFLTHEIGSLAKPEWRVKAFSGAEIREKDIEDAKHWGKILQIPETEELLNLLSKKNGFDEKEKSKILSWSSIYAIKFLEKAGLDWVWDGEQQRVEMYEYAVRRIKGFLFHGHVRSFDNKYYCKASCVDEPEISVPYHLEEYQFIKKFTQKPIKIPITGAYTIVDWSFDENYCKNIVPGTASIKDIQKKARVNFFSDTAKNVIYPNLKALIDQGAQILQIDEPAATTKRDEIPEFVETIRQSIGDLAGKAFFLVHICFSDYSLLFPAIESLQGILDEIHLEYANRDTKESGAKDSSRKGYDILKKLKNTTFKIGLGVLDVHTDFIEPPELIRDRILYANEILQDPSRIYISPDCGLRTRSWQVCFEKLKNMVEGKNLALKELGIS